MPSARFPAHAGTDLKALLTACHAQPADDTPRLVLADWLQERDDPRGEMIRLQCQLAAMPAGDPEYDTLFERHQKWWKRYGTRFESEMGNRTWDRGPHDRGLPTVGYYDEEYCWLTADELHDPANAPKDRLSAAVATGWPGMTWVFAGEPIFDDEFDDDLAADEYDDDFEPASDDIEFDRFRGPPWAGSPAPLGVCFTEGADITPEMVAEVVEVPNLRGLSLYETDARPAVLPRVARLKSLTHLDLGFVRLNDDGVKTLAPLKNLRSLIAPAATITNAGAARLAGFTELRELKLGTLRLTAAGYRSLALLTNLEVLQLEKCDDAAVRHLAPLSRLRRLNLTGTGVTGRGLDAFPLLTHLTLEDSQANDAGMACLAALPRLRVLDVAQTKITGATFAHLSGSRWLEDLYAAEADVRDKHLVHLEGLKYLDTLSVWGTKVTKRGAQALSQKRKGLSVIR